MIKKNTNNHLTIRKIDYIGNPDFDHLDLETIEKELASVTIYQEPEEPAPDRSDDVPSYILKMYSTPLLTQEGEMLLFKKMNFLRYLAEKTRTELNSRKRNNVLGRQILKYLSESESVRKQIIESNLRLAFSIARKHSKGKITFDDLVGEANLILMKAVMKFDYSKGFRFSTYVTHSVQRHIYGQFRKVQKRGKSEILTSEEILREVVTNSESTIDIHAEDKVNLLMSRMENSLEDREKLIIRERFGLNEPGKSRTLQSLSDDLGICKERVRQLHHKALEKLKELAAELSMEPNFG